MMQNLNLFHKLNYRETIRLYHLCQMGTFLDLTAVSGCKIRLCWGLRPGFLQTVASQEKNILLRCNFLTQTWKCLNLLRTGLKSVLNTMVGWGEINCFI